MEKIIKQPLKILHNDIPSLLIGKSFGIDSGVRFNNVPPIKDNTYFSLVELTLFVVDSNTGNDLGRYTAEKRYYFKAEMSEQEAVEIIYKCYLETIVEFNSVIKNSNLVVLFMKEFQSQPRETIIKNIISSLRFNSLN